MIRRHFAGAVLAFGLAFSAPAVAQAPPPAPSHLEAAREMIVLSGIAQSFDSIFVEFREGVRQTFGATRPELTKDLNEVVEALKPESDAKRDEIIVTASEIFARRMPESDLREVSAFFKSPVGRRYNAFRTQALDEIFTALQPWSVQTSNFLFDRLSEEMRKRGHQL